MMRRSLGRQIQWNPAAWFKTGPGESLAMMPQTATARRKLLSIMLVGYIVVIVGLTAVYNVPAFFRQLSLRATVESQSATAANLGRIIDQLESERRSRAELIGVREGLYSVIPDISALPLLTRDFEELGERAGVAVDGVDYTEPRWSGGVGQVRTRETIAGSFAGTLAYVSAMSALAPSGRIESIDMTFSGRPGRIEVGLEYTVSILNQRPESAPAWDRQSGIERADEAIASLVIEGYPFTPSAEMWQRARTAGMPLPELRLSGIGRSGEDVVAIIWYDGTSRLVKVGDRIDGIRIEEIGTNSVTLSIEGRTSYLTSRTSQITTGR